MPDYRGYSVADLRDALRHVDAERFPDRAEAIRRERRVLDRLRRLTILAVLIVTGCGSNEPPPRLETVPPPTEPLQETSTVGSGTECSGATAANMGCLTQGIASIVATRVCREPGIVVLIDPQFAFDTPDIELDAALRAALQDRGCSWREIDVAELDVQCIFGPYLPHGQKLISEIALTTDDAGWYLSLSTFCATEAGPLTWKDGSWYFTVDHEVYS